MDVKVENLPKSQVKINVVVPNNDVQEAYNTVLAEVVKSTEIPGFRKGNAPKDKVLEQTDISKLYGEVVNVLLETYYPRVLKEKLIQPVSNPKVEIKELALDKPFEFDATVAVKPDIKLGDYKKEIKKAFEEKNKELRKQNEAKLKAGEEIEPDHVHLTPNEIIQAITKACEVEVADILVEQEANRMLSQLVDQASKIGLTLEKYLEAQEKTEEDLRKNYEKSAEETIKAEFILGNLVKEENVEVSDEELAEALRASGVENPEERLKDPTEKWYIKSVLEKNKLITKLAEEIEGKHEH